MRRNLNISKSQNFEKRRYPDQSFNFGILRHTEELNPMKLKRKQIKEAEEKKMKDLWAWIHYNDLYNNYQTNARKKVEKYFKGAERNRNLQRTKDKIIVENPYKVKNPILKDLDSRRKLTYNDLRKRYFGLWDDISFYIKNNTDGGDPKEKEREVRKFMGGRKQRPRGKRGRVDFADIPGIIGEDEGRSRIFDYVYPGHEIEGIGQSILMNIQNTQIIYFHDMPEKTMANRLSRSQKFLPGSLKSRSGNPADNDKTLFMQMDSKPSGRTSSSSSSRSKSNTDNILESLKSEDKSKSSHPSSNSSRSGPSSSKKTSEKLPSINRGKLVPKISIKEKSQEPRQNLPKLYGKTELSKSVLSDSSQSIPTHKKALSDNNRGAKNPIKKNSMELIREEYKKENLKSRSMAEDGDFDLPDEAEF